jgi:hypothetical protein
MQLSGIQLFFVSANAEVLYDYTYFQEIQININFSEKRFTRREFANLIKTLSIGYATYLSVNTYQFNGDSFIIASCFFLLKM